VMVRPDAIRQAVNRAGTAGVDALYLSFSATPVVWTIRLVRAALPWRYVGATKEYITCDLPFKTRKVDAPYILDYADGSSRADKYRRDVELLREELVHKPDDARSWFCLGESYRGLHQHELAVIAYTNCAVKTHSGEERYLGLTLSGEMLLALGKTEEGIARLLMADQERPQRREALLMACQVLNKMGRCREVVKLLEVGPTRRPLPQADLAGIIPAAYGTAMERELRLARSTTRSSRSESSGGKKAP
jgi:hypothetical protein